jgi:hypothetical protein
MTTKTKRPRRRQNLAYGAGIGAGLLAMALFLFPANEKLHARGPMNAGHEDLKCASCHKDAPGSARQQIQANLRFILGQRQTPADFGHGDVGNEICLACHERPNDRHPVYRFLEPRFAKVRLKLHPETCLSCHAEHTGKRITVGETGYCVNCHKETKLRKDPVDVPHERLIALRLWETCLGCHDFHGNHIMKTAKAVENAIPRERIRAYFEGGPSPFGEERYHKAKKEVDDG